jgi:hypothetical protein
LPCSFQALNHRILLIDDDMGICESLGDCISSIHCFDDVHSFQLNLDCQLSHPKSIVLDAKDDYVRAYSVDVRTMFLWSGTSADTWTSTRADDMTGGRTSQLCDRE